MYSLTLSQSLLSTAISDDTITGCSTTKTSAMPVREVQQTLPQSFQVECNSANFARVWQTVPLAPETVNGTGHVHNFLRCSLCKHTLHSMC